MGGLRQPFADLAGHSDQPLSYAARDGFVREIGYAGGKSAHAQAQGDWDIRVVRVADAGWLRHGQGRGLCHACFDMLGVETINSPWLSWVWTAAAVLSWLATVLCIVRGAPVMIEAFRWEQKERT